MTPRGGQRIDSDAPDDGVPEGWTQIGVNDRVWDPPVPLATPLTMTRPTELEFAALTWQNFEKLLCWLVPKLERTQNVHLYGRPGQAQHGIDIACLPSEGEPTVYQAKHYEVFGASDLRTAVDDFANGVRPFDAQKFVVVVACRANDTATLEMLVQCQRRHGDPFVELWDRGVLSRLLADHPSIVEQFFGEHTRQAFCGGPASGGSVDSVDLRDYVMRGPIRHLELSSELRQAEEHEVERPQAAAARFGKIATALREADFAGHAHQYRLRQADMLERAGELVDASEIRLSVAWDLIDSADLWTANVAASKVAETVEHIPESIARSLRAVGKLVATRLGLGPELIDTAEVIDALQTGDPHRHVALLAFAEEALVTDRLDLVQQRASAMHTAINELALDEKAPLVAARLRACIADATGDWPQLRLHARTRYAPDIAALIYARHGRHAALHGDVELAVDRYQEAIRAATDSQNYGDAWAWLYALRSACLLNDQPVSDDIGDVHRIAETIRAHGDLSAVPHGRTRAQALSKLSSQQPIEAYEAIRRHIRHSTVTASLLEETEAHTMFGQLLASAGRLHLAIEHYVVAGAGEAAAQLADHWPDQAFVLDADIMGRPNWQRAAAFETVTAFEDWLPDGDGARWAATALQEVLHDPGPATAFRARARHAAYGTLAATASHLRAADAKRFLEHVEGGSETPRANNLHADDHSVTVVYEIARSHPEVAGNAVAVALRLLLRVPYRSAITWTRGYDVLRQHQHIVREHLTTEAQAGDLTSCIVMASAECVDEPVLDKARRRLEQAIAPREREPGVQHIGTSLPDDALLIRNLATDDIGSFVAAMMVLAVDVEEPIPNRREALGAAEACMRELPELQRSDFFEAAMECADGLHDDQGANPLPLGDTDPLARYKVSFGPRSLRAAGLRCAAVSAVTNEQFNKVKDVALGLLVATDRYTADTAALAAAQLPARILAGDLDALRVRPDYRARWLAAMIWAELDDADERIGRSLAVDPSHLVRGGLASSLRDTPIHHDLRQQLCGDVRRAVRRAASRNDR